jgi:chromosome partitioning protein
MKKIAVLNQKGGVGKTTTVVNTAAAIAAEGAKVIVVDMDPQAHLTIHLGVEPQKIDSGSYKVLTQSAPFEAEIMLVRQNLWLLPANINLVGAETELVSVVGRETILREAIQACSDVYDFLFIDCAPSLGLLTLNSLAAVDEVLIPLQPHFLALQGFGKLLQTIELVNKRINPALKVGGILLCMYDSRASLANEVKSDIEQFLKNAQGTNSAWAQACVLPTYIRRNIRLAEAPSYGKTIFEYDPTCNGAQDYRQVARFILAKSGRIISSEQSQEEVTIEENQEIIETPQDEPVSVSEPETVQEDINKPPSQSAEVESNDDLTKLAEPVISSEPEIPNPPTDIPSNPNSAQAG